MAREQRVRPGLDDKVLAAWNALMLKGYVDAFRALGESRYLEAALRNARFLLKQLIQDDGSLMRSYKNGKATIRGFLDDCAFMAEAFLSLYEVTFDERWLRQAENIAENTIRHFHDPDTGMFFYTSDNHEDTVARKMDVTDNVIPASLSSLSRVLFGLGLLLEKPGYHALAEGMVARVEEQMQRYPSAFSNWGILYLQLAWPFHTMVMTGQGSKQFMQAMREPYRPDLLLAGSSKPSSLPILKDRIDPGMNRIFVCTGRECSLPVGSVKEALDLLEG
jgi:uncharacterized protein YyaL (SSP411 family)